MEYYLSIKKLATDTCNNMAEYQNHHVKWTEARHKRLHIVWFLEKAELRRQSRSEVASGWWFGAGIACRGYEGIS